MIIQFIVSLRLSFRSYKWYRVGGTDIGKMTVKVQLYFNCEIETAMLLQITCGQANPPELLASDQWVKSGGVRTHRLPSCLCHDQGLCPTDQRQPQLPVYQPVTLGTLLISLTSSSLFSKMSL